MRTVLAATAWTIGVWILCSLVASPVVMYAHADEQVSWPSARVILRQSLEVGCVLTWCVLLAVAALALIAWALDR